jgi:isoleucyl-tRNA synthetase
MRKFKELPSDLTYSTLETEILGFWKTHHIFEKSISTRQHQPRFSFYEGPPTVNGKPGVHHVLSRTTKDLICRYKTLKGFCVPRKAGWDTHGLPVEIAVEKKLGLKNKSAVEAYGIEEFNREARRLVYFHIQDNKEGWGKLTDQIAYWCDMENAYITCDNSYIESVWWGLKQIFDKGLIYKDYKIVPQDPKSETVLSSHELALGYREVKDPSIYVKFKLKQRENEYFLAWTTTPWTLISNVCLAVHPEVDYVRVKVKDEIYTLAKARLGILGESSEETRIEILEEFKGRALEFVEYEQLLPHLKVKEKAFFVTLGEFVSIDDGTGIVHCAPAFGADDYEISKKYGLPMYQPIARNGVFTDEVPRYSGKFFKDADPEIIAELKQTGKLLRKETITHSYPFSWRYDVPVIYYARESWYIRTTAVAKRMVELNKTINWQPPEIGTGRFGNWLEENKDWALSRERFWGTPLPIWVSEDFKIGDDHTSGNLFCIGSIAELREGFIDINGKTYKLGDALDQGLVELDLHKPFVDRIYFIRNGKKFTRTPELIDVWFDSGAMPFAQLHYPFENREEFERSFPADYICEAVDQTRGWFYTLHAIATLIFDKPAFKNLIVNGHILDKHKQKMSKSKGNVVDPFVMIEKYGADSLRWYLINSSPAWLPKAFDEEEISEEQRKFFRSFIESYRFFTLYANVDGFEYKEERLPISERTELDRWILSSLNTLIKAVDEAMSNYDPTSATRLIEDFTVNNLSNWYIRRSRRRFWKGEMGLDKLAAYQTLYECLITVAKLVSPFCPFIADEIYRNLNTVTGKEPYESVHLSYFPQVEEAAIDKALEMRMKKAQSICSLALSLRKKAELKVRQPLRRMLLPVLESHTRRELEKVKDIILDEVNIKAIEFVDDETGIISKKAKPNFKTLGKKFGKDINAVANRVRALSAQEIAKLEKAGEFEFEVAGRRVKIEREDVEILSEDLEGWLVASDDSLKLTVALDTELSEELIHEGLAREFVSRVQACRKEMGLDITDRIVLHVNTSKTLQTALERNKDYVQNETLATELDFVLGTGKRFVEDINGESCTIELEKK